jgi:predicted nucleic acid-binding protein
MWQWRHNVSPFDACYLALALELQCPVLTSDQRLASAAQGIVPVISV